MQIWRVNVHEQTLQQEAVPETWQRLGGRGLLARILLDEVNPLCEPLGPNNKLVFAPGLLVGHMLSSCDRISVGAKSPLTGGIKEANAGGTTGLHMTTLGIQALILEGQPAQPGLWLLHLSLAGARFEPAGDLAGVGVFAAAERLRQRFGKKVAIALIGPGGEARLLSAGIQNLDKDGVPSRIAARGGLGAVMAAKGLKAIIFDDAGGKKPPIAHPEAFKAANKAYLAALQAHPQTRVYHDYGTAAMTLMCNGFGAIPTKNFSSGKFEQAEQISGELMREQMLQRGGECQVAHACMPGCTIQSSNVYGGPDGKTLVSPLEYETIGLMGSNLCVADLDSIARMNWEVSDMGLDTIEIGVALGVAAEAGLMQWGDVDGALRLLQEVRQLTPLGRIIGGGPALVGRTFGIQRVPVAKGQALSAYEPRAIKGTGVTYATSPQGGDHTSGLTVRAKIDHLDPKGQVAVSRAAQINMAGYDTLGACIFAGFGFSLAPTLVRDFINARYDWGVGDDILQALGRQSLKLEREFNRLAGFTSAHDRLPEWMTREPLPPHNTVFDVPDEELDQVFNW